MARTGTVIVLALLWTAMLLTGGANSRLDPIVMNAIYVGGHPLLATAARIITELGGWRVLIPIAVAATALLLLRGRYRNACLLLLLVLGGRVIVELQKSAVARLRPDLHELLVSVASSSFPSAHSANSTITYLAIAVLVGRERAWIAPAAALALLIGLSRVMLGVHWPSDVIAGWSFGLLWLVLLTPLASPEHDRKIVGGHLDHSS